MNGCRKLFTAAAMLAASAVPAAAKIGAVIVQWGETQVEDGGTIDPADQIHVLVPSVPFRSRRFVNHADHLPAQRCRSFGFDAWLTHGPGEELPAKILVRIRHPLLTRPDGVSATEQEIRTWVSGGTLKGSYMLSEPWEVQPGQWSFDLMVGDEVIASKSFTLEPLPPGSPVSVCDGGPVS